MILALVSLALSLTAAGARQEAPPTLALENGLWFDGTGFSEETFYSVEGRLTRAKPARIEETLDLAGGFVVPPFGEAHNHNVHDDAEGTLAAYLRELARYGITPTDVAAAGCYPFELATWRLRRHLRHDPGDLWTRAANYHSRTPRFNAVYRADLMKKAAKWADWLEARFVTLDVTQAGATPSTPAMKVAAARAAPTAQPTAPRSARAAAPVPRPITFTRANE